LKNHKTEILDFITNIWNYLFYSTWRLLINLGEILFERPLIFFFNLIPFFRNNWKKGKKSYNKFKYNLDFGTDILFAKYIMISATSGLYISICLYVEKYFNFTSKSSSIFYIIIVIFFSWATNYLLLEYKSTYKYYFSKFDEKYKNGMNYLWVILFHLGILAFTFLSIHLTTGFNLA